MPTIIPVKPRFDDDDDQEQQQQPSSPSIKINVIFAGLPVSRETQVHADVAKPHVTTVSDLSRCISQFCVEQHPQSSSSSPTVADIKLNLNGVNLTDMNERIDHAVARVVGKRSSTTLPKCFVSGKFLSASVAAAANQNAAAGALRRDRANNSGENMSVEQADAMANMMASNPDLIASLLQQDPTMQEMMRNNPELARQMRDPDTIREILRSQLGGRESRAQSDTAMAGAMAQVMAHPDGYAAIERALGQEGLLVGENGEGSLFNVSSGGGNSMADAASSSANNNGGNLLPLENQNPFGMFGMPQPVVPQQQQQESEEEKQRKLKSKIDECIAALKEMGFDQEVVELAANEAGGDLPKAISLIEEWQD